MSDSASESSGSSFSSGGASNVGSDNTDSRALSALQSRPDEDVDVESNNKSIQEGIFSTICLLTKNRALDSSTRLAVLKTLLEFLQLFVLLFNPSWPWSIQEDLWIYKAIQWVLLRQVFTPKGYGPYIAYFYFQAGAGLAIILVTAWIALVLKGDDASNIWVKRLISVLRLLAMGLFAIFWVTFLDYTVFLFDCQWTNLAQGLPVNHIFFRTQSCTAMPHIAHMLFAGLVCIIFCGMALMMSIGYTDLNPMTRSWLAMSDATAGFKILALKMVVVFVSTGLDCVEHLQVVVVCLASLGIFYYHFVELPYYALGTNIAWTGFWSGLLGLSCTLVNLEFTLSQHTADPGYVAKQTSSVMYTVLFSAGVAALLVWARVRFQVGRMSRHLHAIFEQRKQLALAAGNGADVKARAAGASAVTLMGDLKGVHRYKDVRQVSVLCRDMRKWDEDNVPDAEAAEYGEFILKSGMARMPDNPALMIMYASFLIEVRKDGQGARTQLQLAQKANPSLVDSLNIYMAQQLAKQLKRDGTALDLMGYVEFQRNYRSCVRMHKLALMAQRAFWNSLIRSDKILFRDIQRSLAMMEETEGRAMATYRRVLERYPTNGRLLKVYGRFLEYNRNDPYTASKYYEEAMKQGTSESLLNMARSQAGNDEAFAGSVNEKVDGLVIINAQGLVMMINAAAVAMFGYEKGELEGKNVSVLMPQPFSTQHNEFLQRYTQTGEPHILDKTRQMVALHKDRSVFPLSLCATRLTGMGPDTLFMGVLRRLPPVNLDGSSSIRFWVTASGMILCADASVADNFGLGTNDLVGQSFAKLCTDVEGVNRFITGAGGDGSAASGNTEARTLQAQIMHTYLPAVDVELSMQSGGSLEKSSECQFFIIQAHLVSESQATMALDHRGRVVYVTDKLSSMLGYPVATLLKMDLNALLPQPFTQMHEAWFRDLSRAPHPTSCRSGGVVHLLAANGVKVPVTLKMSRKEGADSKRLLHIVQVSRSDECARLNQQRLLLDVSCNGTILKANQGVPNILFGFSGAELVGLPLAAVIDVFGLWRHTYGEDNSLLALLAHQALGHSNCAPAAGSSHTGSVSWRVGIHQPVTEEGLIAQHAAKLASAEGNNKEPKGLSASHLLDVLQQRDRLTAACMTAEMLQHDHQGLEDAAVLGTIPVMQVSLHRSDALTAIIELDKSLCIAHADQSAGLMLGCDAKQLSKKSFPRLMDLPPSTVFEDLLGTKATKKGVMKTAGGGGAATARMGVAKKIAAHHLGDGKPLSLEIQALTYVQGGKTHMLVRLQLQDTRSASMSALVELREGRHATRHAAAAKLALADTEAMHTRAVKANVASHHSGGFGEQEDPEQRTPLGKEAVDVDSFNRTSHWVRENSRLPKSPAHSPRDGGLDEKPLGADLRSRHQQQNTDEEPSGHVATNQGSKYASNIRRPNINEKSQSGRGRLTRRSCSTQNERVGSDYDDGHSDSLELWEDAAGPDSVAESASIGGSASNGGDANEAAGGRFGNAGDAHDDDLAMDARRAKRLKKLNRMVHSTAAQSATMKWKSRTLALLAAVLVAHVVCFVAVTMQVNSRYKNAQDVANMAKGLDRFQLTVLRCQLIQKCWLDQFKNITACSAANMQVFMNKLQENINLAEEHHLKLYLGANKLQPFSDLRLMDYWTYHMLPEHRYYDVVLLDNGTVVEGGVVNFNRSLWEMGNVLLAAAKDVHFQAPSIGKNLNDYFSYQYVMLNGPKSIFDGYSWSLDSFVGHVWRDLVKLSSALVALLLVEAVVLVCCMAYECYLLQQCNVSHMRLFSVFLALPSATIRLLAQRQFQVDEDTKEDVEVENMDMLAGCAVGVEATDEAEGALGDKSSAEKKKSVRVVVEHDLSSDEDAVSPHAKHSNGRGRKSGSSNNEGKGSSTFTSKSAISKAKKKPAPAGFALFRKSTYKYLLGWMDPKFKRNGRTLLADSRVIVKFMVPLLMWMSVIVIIYSASYSNLQGLQGPLASLDTGAHVLYRMSRTRLMSGMLAFSESAADNAYWRGQLQTELTYFKDEYATLLYGCKMRLQANVSFDPVAPASALSGKAITNLFFKTTGCIRWDQSQCITSPSDPYYDITHNGLDVLINRYLDELTAFSLLPDDQVTPTHPAFAWVLKLAGSDLYEGMQSACDLFVAGTLAKFEAVKRLHIILLVVSLACMALFLVMLYRPYIKQLHQDSKAVAGMLSQLPAEVDVEGHVKAIVLGAGKPPATAVGQATMGMGAQGGPGMSMSAGMMNKSGFMMLPAAANGMQGGFPSKYGSAAGYGACQSGGWPDQQHSAYGPYISEGNTSYKQDDPMY